MIAGEHRISKYCDALCGVWNIFTLISMVLIKFLFLMLVL